MRIAIAFFILLSIAACKKETGAPTAPLSEMRDTAAQLLLKGNFQNGPYGAVSGKGSVYKSFDGTYAVSLDSFSTNNGPDLYVYLSKEIMPVNFIEVGRLRSTAGNQVYTLTGMPDLATYKYICIHCKAFNHLFGYALIN